MAQKTMTCYYDDVTGRELDGADVVTVKFSVNGTHYEFDTDVDGERAFHEDMEPWVRRARKRVPKPSTAMIRHWARENGMDVPARGILPHDIVQAYRDAHGTVRVRGADNG